MKKLLLFGFLFFINHSPIWLQIPELDFIQTIEFEDFDHKEFQNLTNLKSSGNLVLVDKSKGIFQLGETELGLLDMESGRTLKKMDMHELLPWVSEAVHPQRGEEFCILGREDFPGRVKPEYYPIQFQRVMRYPGNNKFASLTRTVILNQDSIEEKDLFYGLLIITGELEILDFIPLKGYEEINHTPFMSSGGFALKDFLFTKILAYNHRKNYEFVKFRKSPEGVFEVADTMDHWPIVDKDSALSGPIYNVLENDDGFHFPLVDKIHIVEDWTDNGVTRDLPLEEDQFLHSLEPISQTQWTVAMVVNAYVNVRNEWERTFVSGQLSLIAPNYTRIIPMKDYDMWDRKFRSLSTYENKVALLFYDLKKKAFNVDVYEFREVF